MGGGREEERERGGEGTRKRETKLSRIMMFMDGQGMWATSLFGVCVFSRWSQMVSTQCDFRAVL